MALICRASSRATSCAPGICSWRIFWIATAYVAGGLFLAPALGGSEPKGQVTGVNVLFGALLVVVVGSLLGEMLGINQLLGKLWFWFGHQGWEYLDLGRAWQVLLAVGLVFWLVLLFRAIAPARKRPGSARDRPRCSCIAAVGDPALLSAGDVLHQHHQLHRRGHVAVLDHPPLGRGIL